MKLYGKIFLSFWLVVSAILGSAALMNRYLDEYGETVSELSAPSWAPNSAELLARGRRIVEVDGASGNRLRAPPRRILSLLYELQNTPAKDMPTLVGQRTSGPLTGIYLVTPDGREMLGRELPRRAQRLLGRLPADQRRARAWDGQGPVTAYRLHHNEVGPMAAVLLFSAAERNVITDQLSKSPWLRMPLALAVSGLLCWLLSTLLTRRLRRVQIAANRLANGDLDAQIPVLAQGGDETDQLARDFNRMARQLADKVMEQRRLLHDVSHELRSPLARLRIALGIAQRASTRGADDAAEARALLRIETEVERLDSLIRELLSVPEQAVDGEDAVDLGVLLAQLCNDANFEYAGKPARARLALEHSQKHGIGERGGNEMELPHLLVRGSGHGLYKLFDNVLRNAMQHTATDTEVVVEAGIHGDWMEVVIRDNGQGVAQEHLERLFDPFYRVDASRSGRGYGLGLNIAMRLAQQHGGSVRAANRLDSPTGGLEVSVQLPAMDVSHSRIPD